MAMRPMMPRLPPSLLRLLLLLFLLPAAGNVNEDGELDNLALRAHVAIVNRGNKTTDPDICEPGGSGLLMPIFGQSEQTWPTTPRIIFYAVCLSWCFLGVSIIADIFMGGIEAVTSKRRTQVLNNGQTVTLKVWNATVANLTLMALGSSAPEILLNVIEILSNDFYAGPLGPSTIVGSAAFNLLCIMAICVAVIPPGESRTIRQIEPFLVTAFFSVFAYVWLIFVLGLNTPDKVDVWEGVLTFCFFPILTIIAFLADKGYFTKGGKEKAKAKEKAIQTAMTEAGIKVTEKDAHLLTQAAKEEAADANPTRAARRADQVAGKCIAAKELSVGFVAKKFCYHEDNEELLVELEKVGTLTMEMRVGIEYQTYDGNMMASVGHYTATTGFLEIPAGEKYARVVIPRSPEAPKLATFQDDLAQDANDDGGAKQVLLETGATTEPQVTTPAAYFFLELVTAYKLPSGTGGEPGEEEGASAGKTLDQEMKELTHPRVNVMPEYKKARVAISAIKDKGKLRFDVAQLVIPGPVEDTDSNIVIRRFNGSEGTLKCTFKCENDSAKAGYDYDDAEGELVFGPGVAQQTVQVRIHKKDKWENEDRFYMLLEPSPDYPNALEEDGAIMSVLITCDKAKGVATKMMRFVDQKVNLDAVSEGNIQWKAQFLQALRPCAVHDEDDLQEASAADWTIHCIALPWKLLFALVPPQTYCDGWLCFFVALAMIGGVTALIGDLAGLLGCVMGLPSAITAITIVAVGTSLPDAFASKAAACDDETADNAIGNVTGSNSVNVFLGIGLPWMAAAIYWEIQPASFTGPGSKWYETYPEKSPGFIVIAGDLVFSVIVFTLAALACLGLIWWRRKTFQAELGGPQGAKVNTCIFMVLLWFFYVGLAIWKVGAGHQDTGQQLIAIFCGMSAVVVVMLLLTSISSIMGMLSKSASSQNTDLLERILGILDPKWADPAATDAARGSFTAGSTDVESMPPPEILARLKDQMAATNVLVRALEGSLAKANMPVKFLPKEKVDAPAVEDASAPAELAPPESPTKDEEGEARKSTSSGGEGGTGSKGDAKPKKKFAKKTAAGGSAAKEAEK